MKVMLCTLLLILFFSCGSSMDGYTSDKKGFASIESVLNEKFGDNAYYTELAITFNASIGNSVSVTVTEAPESLKMGQWNLAHGHWNQNSEISLEVPRGSQAADFMFQFDEEINLSKLGELVEKSKEHLRHEKAIDNPVLRIAFIKFPKNGETPRTEYHINLKSQQGGTSYRFSYNLNGDLIDMNY